MRTYLLTFLLVITFVSVAQITSTIPTFPTSDGAVVITYDASEGNGVLAGHTGTVYAHTGVITSASTSGTDWKWVQGDWGTSNAPVMTSIGNNKYTLSMANIRDFYGVPGNETILKLAFVFRDLSGNTVGRATGGGDIFIDVFTNDLSVSIINPPYNSIQDSGLVSINIQSSDTADITLFINGNQLLDSANTTGLISNYNASPGNYEIITKAENSTKTVYDTSNFVVNGTISVENVPSGLKNGINYLNDSSITLVLVAPFKNFIYVLGDFNDWKVDADYVMKKDPDGIRWWLTISDLEADNKYGFQYFVDGNITIADPYSEEILDQFEDFNVPSSTYPNLHQYPWAKTTGNVSVLDMDRSEFEWTTTNFSPPKEEDLVIYELLVRDFIAAHDYQTLIDTLDYLENLGINAIELMPVNEFEGNESWGYNPSFHMALDKYYGTKNAFKTFIDECHRRGIAVILDVVYNHAFSRSPLCQLYWDELNFKPAANNPFLNTEPRHDFNVGFDFNHDSPLFRDFLKQVMQYWLAEYKVDGFRFDLSKGFTQINTLGNESAFAQYDQSRINNLNRIYTECKSVNADAYLILEHFANNDEETALVNRGFMIWGNMNHEFTEAAMGYSSNLQGASHQSRSWSNMRLIAYAESHDEERMMYKSKSFGNSNGSYNVKSIATALDRNELAHVFLMSIPGPKMIWQFEELGYDHSINENGRTGNKPIKWNYLTQPDRRDVYDVYAAINKLKTGNDAWKTNDFALDVGGTGKRIHLNGTQTDAVVIGNFDVVAFDMAIDFQHTGWWYEYFSGDSIEVSNTGMSFSFEPGEYMVWTDVNLNPNGNASISNLTNVNLKVYPNPSTSEINFNLNQSAKVELLSLEGKLIASTEGYVGSNSIDITSLPPGVFLLKAIGKKNTFTARFIKK